MASGSAPLTDQRVRRILTKILDDSDLMPISSVFAPRAMIQCNKPEPIDSLVVTARQLCTVKEGRLSGRKTVS
jgi:hypothetical protein